MATSPDPISDLKADTDGPRPRTRSRLRNYFLTGVIVAGPLAITLYLTWWFVTLVDGWVKPLVPSAYLPDTYLPFAIPGLGLLIAFLGLTLLGFLTANLVGRSLISAGELMLARMPVVRGIYKGVKQLFETVFSQDGTSFRTVGLVEFPVKGTWSVVFVSSPATMEVQDRLPAARRDAASAARHGLGGARRTPARDRGAALTLRQPALSSRTAASRSNR
jgi:uncharacterized membrane protein